jgi:hypothetical protein
MLPSLSLSGQSETLVSCYSKYLQSFSIISVHRPQNFKTDI